MYKVVWLSTGNWMLLLLLLLLFAAAGRHCIEIQRSRTLGGETTATTVVAVATADAHDTTNAATGASGDHLGLC